MTGPSFLVSREDWSLHRKGHIDQERHREKVRQAIKENLAELVAEESLILADGKKILKVPIRQLEEYKIRFNPDKSPFAGQGKGGTRQGQVIGHAGQSQGPGRGSQAGEEPGIDYYEVEITVDELAQMVFEDLSLPNLQEKERARLTIRSVEFDDVRRVGLMPNVDKRRTLLEAIKRHALAGRPSPRPVIRPEDLRFKVWTERLHHDTAAVVLAMMDTSGSMGVFEKYIARSFYFWMVRFLRTKYDSVEIVFLAHDTRAREVSEEEFFTKGESGGTKCSSVYQLALELIEKRYPPSQYNIYPFHFSDGDNFPSDNSRCVKLIEQLLECSQAVGYGEIASSPYRESSLLSAYEAIKDPRFVTVVIHEKSDVYPALRAFFHGGERQQRGVGL